MEKSKKIRSNKKMQDVQRLGDGSLCCERCIKRLYNNPQLPETGWTVGVCDYCGKK